MAGSPTQLVPAPGGLGSSASVSSDGFTYTASDTSQTVGNNPLAQGSYYFETTITQLVPFQAVGVGSPSAMSTSDNIVYSQAQGCAMLRNDGFHESAGAVYAPGTPSFVVGDVICVAVALPNLFWVRMNGGLWNNSAGADPASGVGGASLTAFAAPFVPVLASNGGVMTANFGATAFAFDPPALFGNWPGAEVITITKAGPAAAGAPVPLAGTTPNGHPASLDFSTDGGTTWSPVTDYVPGDTWTGAGPIYAHDFFGVIVVRDTANPDIVSATAYFLVEAPSTRIQLNNTAWPVLATEVSLTDGYAPPWNASGSTINVGFRNTFIPGNDYFHASNATCTSAWTNNMEFVFDYVLNSGYELNGALGQIVIAIGAGTSNPYGIGEVSLNRVPGQFNTDTNVIVSAGLLLSGHVVFGYSYDPDTQVPTWSLTINGDTIASQAGSNQTIFSDANPPHITFFTYNCFTEEPTDIAIAVTGFGVYDLTPAPEVITIEAVIGTGGTLSVSGSNTGASALAMDYTLDGGAWQPLTNFVPAVAPGYHFAGDAGSAVLGGKHTMQVRDDANQACTSNTFTFVIGIGIFVWDGVKLHS